MANTPKTLPREPWRGSQICGHEISVGRMSSTYCGERKAPGERACMQHAEEMRAEYGTVRYAPGNEYGYPDEPLVLLWEPYDGTGPVQPTGDELSRYAAILEGE
jgi:hypothetical protein